MGLGLNVIFTINSKGIFMPFNYRQLETDEQATCSIEESLHSFDVDPAQGLSGQNAAQRLAQVGANEIVENEESALKRLVKRLWGPIPWMIEIAAILSAIVQHWEDFFIICVMLAVNVALDFFQEHRALNALKVLKQQLVFSVRVKRDGHVTNIPARELVPGDIIRLRLGDVIPADVKLLEGSFLSIDESSMTGESLPVSKRVGNVAYANTVIKQGEMLALVVNTGKDTRFSHVVDLVANAALNEHSHFQKAVIKIGHFLILISLSLITLIALTGLFRHESLLEIARFSLVLAVAAIPVALPAVLSLTMAVGAVNLARKKAIVSRLTAIEELAGVDIFCSDKTGTLTKNQMQVAEAILFNHYSESHLFAYATLASKRDNFDPIELPLFDYFDRHHSETDWLQWANWQQTDFVPFNPVSKFTQADACCGEQHIQVFKGAPQVILDLCELGDNERHAIERSIDLYASKGYRTLAVACSSPEQHVTLVGLIPLIDPEREDSASVIQNMAEHGVKVKMITGDNLAIAREIGQRLGLKQKAINAKGLSGKSGDELLAFAEALSSAIYQQLQPDIDPQKAKAFASAVMDNLARLYDTTEIQKAFIHTHESTLIDILNQVDVIAEVHPEDKYSIIESLQKAGHIVGMTGDGVNDAPALKKADCGFAVSNATDAARAAADIVLTSPGLSVINDAIEQARITFERMKIYATFRVAETLRIILFMALSIVIFDFYPITTLMIILLALLNDIPILTIAYDNTKISQQPVRWHMPRLFGLASILGLSGVVSSFLLFFILREMALSDELIQSLLFLKLIVAGHSTLYVARTEGAFWRKPWPAPILFVATFATEIIGTFIAVYGWFIAPIGWEYALYIWAYALFWFVLEDAIKRISLTFLPEKKIAH